MDATLNALGEILLKAIPTFFLVVFLYFYLKATFFKPMESVLKRRHEATAGARLSAEESLKRAEAKAIEYEAALRTAKSEMYAELEKTRKKIQDERAAAVLEARTKANSAIAEAKQSLAAEVAALESQIVRDADELSESITTAVLQRRVA